MDNIVKLAAATEAHSGQIIPTPPFTGVGQLRAKLWCGSILLAAAAGLFI